MICYGEFVGNPPRTRWGDDGAAVTAGSSIWLASEYIAQTCTLAQYLTAPIGSVVCLGVSVQSHAWQELIPGGAKKDLSAAQAKALLATVRPRDIAGKTRRQLSIA